MNERYVALQLHCDESGEQEAYNPTLVVLPFTERKMLQLLSLIGEADLCNGRTQSLRSVTFNEEVSFCLEPEDPMAYPEGVTAIQKACDSDVGSRLRVMRGNICEVTEEAIENRHQANISIEAMKDGLRFRCFSHVSALMCESEFISQRGLMALREEARKIEESKRGKMTLADARRSFEEVIERGICDGLSAQDVINEMRHIVGVDPE